MEKRLQLVAVVLLLDWDGAVKAGKEEMALDFLRQFKAQGEGWKKECLEDPLLKQFLNVKISVV